MANRVSGTFEVKLTPQAGGDEPAGVGRMTIDKRFSGGLEATSRGVMLAVRTAVEGSAGYVAMEVVEGALDGRRGTFVFQHGGTMLRGEQRLSIEVVPDSATGELSGLSGRLEITFEEGVHYYELEYSLDPTP
jgi:hypothetical protein